MRKFRAFTLIELLVVVAIIALLIAMLLPALARAREQTKMVKCGTNMKAIFTGVATYATQNKDLMLEGQTYHVNGVFAGGTNLSNMGWAEALILDGDVMAKTRTSNGIMTGHNPALGQGIFVCPNADPGMQYGFVGAEYNGYGLVYWATSHFQNIYSTGGLADGAMPNALTSDTGRPRFVKMASLQSGKIFGADGYNAMAGSQGGNWPYWVYQRHLSSDTRGTGQNRYKGSANYVFCDGHVESDNGKYYLDSPGTIPGQPQRSNYWYQIP